MNTIREKVKCSQCGEGIVRVIWNYGRGRPIAEFFCNNNCKGTWQRAQREALGFTREWLIEQYIEKGKNTNEIGLEIGRDGKRVWEWLRDYGIPTRPRGGKTSPGCFQKGQPNPFEGKAHTEATKESLRQQRIKDRHVPYLKNGEHWLKGVPKEHHPNWRGGISPERQSFYSSLEWTRAVKVVWARDNATCQRCGKKHNHNGRREAFHIHHVVSFAMEKLRSSPDNLILLCKSCHLWVHSKKNRNKEFTRG